MDTKAQADLVKAITEIATALPLSRTVQLYEFALFLKSRPLPTEGAPEEIIAEQALWDQFAATDLEKPAALVKSVEDDEDKTLPMFDKPGKLIKPD